MTQESIFEKVFSEKAFPESSGVGRGGSKDFPQNSMESLMEGIVTSVSATDISLFYISTDLQYAFSPTAITKYAPMPMKTLKKTESVNHEPLWKLLD